MVPPARIELAHKPSEGFALPLSYGGSARDKLVVTVKSLRCDPTLTTNGLRVEFCYLYLIAYTIIEWITLNNANYSVALTRIVVFEPVAHFYFAHLLILTLVGTGSWIRTNPVQFQRLAYCRYTIPVFGGRPPPMVHTVNWKCASPSSRSKS
jgi:hypothetical protein